MGEETTHEKVLEAMAKLSPEELKAKMEESRKMCESFCGECPTYTGTGEKELLFCILGRSSVIKEQKGCLCTAGCPVQKNMGLRWDYYCIRGSGKEQMAKEK
ncbi:DUF2769 domain-containing protein [Candidatus Hecatella orcuttiae]|jgi:hypothetical protein|uniref:DUF2769 domain-containing protein n=1 Tax=Candidatus Hecatella orcuttiae TaxID=1935119 RepID=UPI002867DF6E|nr:DUF2769 domain-containing protein [Candidatus Hecatella orcuttiae]